ncbi:hypothetical protein FRC02_008962 [Tulasnella sp. 418]|nr:hypothetical protein FRC02_008962 [Tulasnella sp. 418]
MRVRTLEIRWHNGQPIFSCDYQPLPQQQLKRLISQRSNPPRSGNDIQSPPSYRMATGGSDNHVRMWMVHPNVPPHAPRVEYLSTLAKHAGSVNVVRFSPNGEFLASAGDDGMIIVWMPTDRPVHTFGAEAEDTQFDKEHWKPKIVLRCTSREVYDLAWSPNGEWIIAGSTDNTARIYAAADGTCVREISEHSYYVQGVAWDPLNEFIASQSNDRSVHVYGISTKRGPLEVHAVGKNSRVQVRHSRTPSAGPNQRQPYRRRGSIAGSDVESSITSASEFREDQLASFNPGSATPAPASNTSALPGNGTTASTPSTSTAAIPAPPTPTMSIASTPSMSHATVAPMFPPKDRPTSRRSSFSGSNAPSPAHSSRHMGRSPSPMPPLPAIRTPVASGPTWASFKMYGDDNYTHFFRRLTFSPDGAFLLTPAGQFEDLTSSKRGGYTSGTEDAPSRPHKSHSKSSGSVSHSNSNTEGNGSRSSSVYIYSRANFSRPPIAHLPGHQKATLAVKFSPMLYELRPGVIGAGDDAPEMKRVVVERGKDQTIDLDLGGSTPMEAEPILPSPIHETPKKESAGDNISSTPTTQRSRAPSASPVDSERRHSLRGQPPTPNSSGSNIPVSTGSVFALPYRMLFSVATSDTVMIYDTQQAGPVCMFTNLHYQSFTDMVWAPDGQSLMLASQDGYCTIVVFDEILPLYHTQQHNIQLQSIVQSHSAVAASPSHATSSRDAGYSSVVAPPSPALSVASTLPRGGTPSFVPPPAGLSTGNGTALGLVDTPSSASTSLPRKRTDRSESIVSTGSISGMGALMERDFSSASVSEMEQEKESSKEEIDAQPVKKKRRIALTHHTPESSSSAS